MRLRRIGPLILIAVLPGRASALELVADSVGALAGPGSGGGYDVAISGGLAVMGPGQGGGFDVVAGHLFPHPLPSPTEVGAGGLPPTTRFGAIAPNPLVATTRFSFEVAGPDPVPVRLEVFDVSGRSVALLIRDTLAPGVYSTSWDGRDGDFRPLAHGIYFARFVAGSYIHTASLVIVH